MKFHACHSGTGSEESAFFMHIIGIVGTAKNTGKTTTLAALIGEAGRRHERIGVTGIGYDGEEIDTITGLPKPRLMLQPGTIVATSERCLLNTSARYAVIKTTSARTALGAVVLVEILEAGLMVLAGPNTKLMLRLLIDDMETLGLTTLLVDGSLNRIAAMSVVEVIVFTTGASRSTEISLLAEEARAICGLFKGSAAARSSVNDCITVQDAAGGTVGTLPMRSLFDAVDAERVALSVTGVSSRIFIPNIVSIAALEHLVRRLHADEPLAHTLIVADPTIVLLAGDPIATFRLLRASSAHGVSVGFGHSIRVAAMTVNPFYPLQDDNAFKAAYIDKETLQDAVSGAVDVPVFNIKDDTAAAALFDTCMNKY
jgi:hypothetical protein